MATYDGGRGTPPPGLPLSPELKIVFVLGAGFSRPLGGLLLPQLLAYRPVTELLDYFPAPEGSDGSEPSLAHHLFAARAFCQAGMQQGHWSHAEDFLERLEAELQRPSDLPSTISSIIRHGGVEFMDTRGGAWPAKPRNVRELVDAARRAIVADCSLFLLGQKPEKDEKWGPYIEWTRGLEPHHTVVTFNYDPIPEMLVAHVQAQLSVIRPDDPAKVQRAVEMARLERLTPVLKVHGSTTTLVRDGQLFTDTDCRRAIERSDGSEFLIGIPGPAKVEASMGRLKPLWDHAVGAIRDADVVVFIGFRFPESDAFARSTLLAAIRKNRSPHLRLQTVLGPRNPDAERLMYLLDATVGGTPPVEQLPLYAQDYLDIVWARRSRQAT